LGSPSLGAMPRKTAAPDELEDPHYVRRYIQRRLELLASDAPVGQGLPLGRRERDALLAFVRARRSEVSDLRVRTYLSWLPLAAARLGSKFLDPDRETPAHFNEAFTPKQYARGSRVTIAQCLLTFWRWRFETQGRDFPAWLRIRLERWKPVAGPSDMLTRDEVALMAEHAQNFRDKAWIWTLFNSGCRPGEIYRLRIGDVVPHDEGYIELRVTREKGSAPEPAPVYEDAVPALLAWLAAHPRGKELSAPMWVDIGGHRVGRIATYRAMYKALEAAAQRAKIAKHVTAYALRRSRLTMLAKDPAISTSILEKVAGWVPGSKVAQHYVHLSGKDVINALNARYGVQAADPRDSPLPTRTPSRCGRCKMVNPAGAAYCMTCGGPLSLPAVRQIEEARSAEERLAELLRNPEAVEFLANLLAEGEKGKGRVSRHSTSGGSGSGSAAPPDMVSTAAGPGAGRRLPAQKVVPLSDAEGLILCGYELIAVLGADRAVLRAPPLS
ncbi:MAG TPA: site-specific integrase, partial [Acidimicrobiales bacterium]|nr:site-specific integrase [Acidimicrobiales bacterium]